MSSGWLIDGPLLENPARRGGRENRRGGAYHDSYAVFKLAALADPSDDLIALRSEGAQDVDLRFADERQRYVQLKDSRSKRYTIVSLAPIIAAFVCDWLDARDHEKLEFELVASGSVNEAVAAIRKHGIGAGQSNQLIEQVLKDPICMRSEIWANAGSQERRVFVEAVIARTTLTFGHGPTADGNPSFDDAARVRLVRLGVEAESMDEAYAALRSAMRDGQGLGFDDVRKALAPFMTRRDQALRDGALRVVDRYLLDRKASPDAERAFFGPGLLSWGAIASKIDVERDQASSIAALVREQPEQLAMVVVAGSPGTGKSTVVRRVGATLAEEGRIVLHLLGSPDRASLQRLDAFTARLGEKVVIIVDDVFRRGETVHALADLEPSLPVTFLATSNANEYVDHAIAGRQHGVELEPISDAERKRLLIRFGIDLDRLDPDEARRFLSSPTIATLVREATGEGGEVSQRRAIERLAADDEDGYEIYARVAFSSKAHVGVPVSLLTRVGGQVSRPSLRGLVNRSESGADRVAGHSTTAAIAWSVFAERRDPLTEFRSLMSEVDRDSPEERWFALSLARSALGSTEHPDASDAATAAEAFYAETEPAMGASELSRWVGFWRAAGRPELAEAAMSAATGRKPANGADLTAIVSALRQEGKEITALLLLEEYLGENDWEEALATYVRTARLFGTPAQRRRAFERSSSWLRANPHDRTVRSALLKLAAEEDAELLTQQMDDTIEWLDQQPDDLHSRASVLHAAARGGEDRQVRKLFADTRDWLGGRADAFGVWTGLAAMVFAKGSGEERGWLEARITGEDADPAVIHAIARGNPEATTWVLAASVDRLERQQEASPGNSDLLTAITSAARRLSKAGRLAPLIERLHARVAARPGEPAFAWQALAYADATIGTPEGKRLVEAGLSGLDRVSVPENIELLKRAREVAMRLPRKDPTRQELLDTIAGLASRRAMASEASPDDRKGAASFLLEMRRADLVVGIAERSARQDPDDVQGRELLAWALLHEDDLQRSLDEWDALVRRVPAQARYRYGRGRVAAALAGQELEEKTARSLRQAAERDFREALAHWTLADGSREQVLRHRAWGLIHLGRPRQALATIGEIQGPTAYSESIRIAVGTALLDLGSKASAKRVLLSLRSDMTLGLSTGAKQRIDELLAEAEERDIAS